MKQSWLGGKWNAFAVFWRSDVSTPTHDAERATHSAVPAAAASAAESGPSIAQNEGRGSVRASGSVRAPRCTQGTLRASSPARCSGGSRQRSGCSYPSGSSCVGRTLC